MWNALPIIALQLSVPALAADAPEYLLGDLSVRLDLSKSRWHMSRWSDWDFEARVDSDPIFLQAWATPVRAPVEPADPWGAVFSAKAEENKGSDPKVTGATVEEIDGRKYAFVDVSFTLKNVGPVVLRGAVTEIAGKNFLVAVMAPARLAGVANKDRAEVVRTLEFTAEVPPAEYGGIVKTDRVTTDLPEGWRPVAENELDSVTPGLLKLGLEDLTGCWTALRPRVAATPDVMVTCPRPIHLGVVDEYSWSAHDEVVREKLFGKEVPAGEPVAMPDRTGIVYAPRDGLAFGVAPDSDQVQVTWALGDGPLGDDVRAALIGSTFAQPHAVTPGDQVSYWLRSRPLSPVVLCPLGCVCGGGLFFVALVGGVMFLRRSRRGEDDE